MDRAQSIAIQASEAPLRTNPIYPEPFSSMMVGVKTPLGDLFGIKNIGVNLTRLSP